MRAVLCKDVRSARVAGGRGGRRPGAGAGSGRGRRARLRGQLPRRPDASRTSTSSSRRCRSRRAARWRASSARSGDGVTGVAVGDRVIASTGWGGLAEKVGGRRGRAASPCPDGVDLVARVGVPLRLRHVAPRARRTGPGCSRARPCSCSAPPAGSASPRSSSGAAMGATVIAAASSDDKLALCREHGAAMTINYATEDLKARVRELTGGHGADVVYDPVGGAYSEPALRSMAWDGRFLVIGFAAGDIPRRSRSTSRCSRAAPSSASSGARSSAGSPSGTARTSPS